MKFSIAYYLVLLYATVLFKPLLPLISDVWSHEFNGLEHISLVHAKYGSNHLQKELADTTDKESNKKQNNLKSGDEVSFHVAQPLYKYDFLFEMRGIAFILFNPAKLAFVLLSNQGPPPKFRNNIF